MLSDCLREYRKKMGYTQQEVASLLGIDRSTYTYYETGKTEIPVKKLEVLAKLYCVDISDFLELDMVTLSSSDKEKRQKTEVGMLSTEERQLLAKIRLLDSAAKRMELRQFLEQLENSDKDEQ